MIAERVLMALLLGGVAVGCVLVLYPFFSALLWAAILTYTTWPALEWLRTQARLGRLAAAAIMVLSTAVLVVLPMALAAPTSSSDVQNLEHIVQEALAAGLPGAPAWLYGAGAHAALAEMGFALAEDHMKVWQPTTGQVLARGPVVTWASRSPGRIQSSLGFAAIARRVLPVMPVLRLAVHPGDVTVPALLTSIDRTLARFVSSHAPSRYADLAG